MLFDIGFGEFFIIAVLGLIVVGPERLPSYAAQAAKFMRQLRGQVQEARTAITDAAAIDPDTLRDIKDLDPRKILSGEEIESKKTKDSLVNPDTT
jgi:sec-independent protein translocase protein TatB